MNLILTAITAAPVGHIESTIGPVVAPVAGNFSFSALFLQADLVVQSVMVLLIVASIWSWAIIIHKLLSIKNVKKKMQTFENEFWSGIPLEKLFKKTNRNENPLSAIFTAAMQELQEKNSNSKASDLALRASTQERASQAMQVAGSRFIDQIEHHLNFLAITASSAPFIGLFGTVWGIMVSFQSIAISKNTTLAVVAPGIAEALLATALGLAVAIPAMIFYNKFASEVNRIANRLEHFSMELNSIISRELDHHLTK